MAENLQRIRFFRKEVEVPRWLRYFCNLPTDIAPHVELLQPFEQADLVLLEPNTTIDIFYGPYALHRSNVLSAICDKVRDVGPEIHQAIDLWWYRGIVARDREAQREAALTLIPALTGRVDDERVAQKILLECHGEEQSAERYHASIAEFCEIVDLPIGLVTFIYRFLPDGRPIGWPADFIENTIAVARTLNLPMLDSAEIVSRHGVDVALDKNQMLYRPEFVPTVAEEVLKFCQQVLECPVTDRRAAPARFASGTERRTSAEG